jgi:hypothetical protein
VVLWGLAGAHLLESAGLRMRRDQLEVLPEADLAGVQGRSGAASAVALHGVELDVGTLAAAARDMEEHGVDVVDLLPGELPAEDALRILRRIDPERLEVDGAYTPGGAHQALVLRGELRATGGAGGVCAADIATLVERTVEAQRRAPTSAALRLAPGLRAVRWGTAERWIELEALAAAGRAPSARTTVLVETAHLVLVTAGLLLAPLPGLAALLTWSAQPALVLHDRAATSRSGRDQAGRAGPPWSDRPPGPTLRSPDWRPTSLLRLPRAWTATVGMLRAAVRGPDVPAAARSNGRGRSSPPPA